MREALPAENRTPQEKEWSSEFGNQYTKRSPGSVEANVAFFQKVIGEWEDIGIGPEWKVYDINSVIEFGAGVGNNLRALRHLLRPEAAMMGLEINPDAFVQLEREFPASERCSVQDWYVPQPAHDLAFTKGLLIHIPPADLPRAYAALYGNSRRFVLVAEYYSPKPVMIPYRGKDNMLWKRDFAGEMLDAYPDLRLVDYGFVYHRDPHPQDDITWFLLEKR